MRTINYIAGSWQGQHRDLNKDGFHVIVNEEYILLLVFDGVSSAKNAKAAVDTAINFANEHYRLYYKNHDYNLIHFLEDMNISILRMRTSDAYTTCCVSYIPNDDKYIGKITHLGDSRIYGITDKLVLYTQDHNDPVMPNMLTKCLGMDRLTFDDFYEKNITSPVSRILLCTDGFYEIMLRDPEKFLFILNKKDLTQVKNELHNAVAMQNGDDATYILADFGFT